MFGGAARIEDSFHQTRWAATVFALVAVLVTSLLCSAAENLSDDQKGQAASSASSSPENLIQLHPRVLSGAGPVAEDQFANLAARGVTTIISVDGAVPQVEAARRHGLRYIHLPVGYDRIDDGRAVALAQAVHANQGVIYFHCHHGKHRGPAAASIACVGNGYLSVPQAMAVLAKAGTGKQYVGLHHAVADATPIAQPELQSIQANFVEVAQVSSLTSRMSEISVLADRLHASLSQNGQPDRQELSHDALILKEHFREVSRSANTDDSAGWLDKKQFREWIEQSAKTAEEIEHLWLQESDVAQTQLSKATKRLMQQCNTCHQTYRN